MPWRSDMGMLDDRGVFGDQGNKILIYFAEVKSGKRCTINGPWSNPPRENLPRTLRAIGCIPNNRVDDAANQLYSPATTNTNEWSFD